MNRGAFSLALTLWIVAILSLVSVLYLGYAKQVVDKTVSLNRKLLVTFKAESMVELIKFYGSTGDIEKNYILNNLQSSFPDFPRKIFIDSRETVWDNTTMIFQDTAGLIDIKDRDAISTYLTFDYQDSKEKKDIIRDSIDDWLDKDSFFKLNGAEDTFYQKYGYEARDGKYFSAIDELFLLRGMDSYTSGNIKKLRSVLVMSDQVTRNILTLNDNLLQKIYNLSSTDLAQLKRAKEDDIGRFISLFTLMHKDNYNFEQDGIYPSNVIKAKITSLDGNIKKEIEFLIDFAPSSQKAFEVLEYKD